LKKLQEHVKKTETENNEFVKQWVLRQTITNYISLFLIAYDKLYDIKLDKDIITDYLLIFFNVLNKDILGYKCDVDPYARLIYDIATSIWDDDPRKRESASKSAANSLNEWKAFYMPYDKERIELLKRIITS